MIRTSDRLAEKRSLPDPIQSESSVTTSESANEPKLSAGAKRNRRYRQRIKDDPLQYNAYREKETQRLKIYKANLTLEQKDFEREKARIRVAEWRKRQKELGKPLKNPKPQTRACVEERREKDRLRQQRYRAGLAQRPQKRGWMTKKKLQQEEAKKRGEMLEPSSTEKKSPACTSALKSKVTLKLIKKLPKDPQLFAEVIEEVVEAVQFTSPRKKHALQLKNILPRSARREIAFSTAVLDEVSESYQQLKNLKTSAHNVKRAALANILLKANKGSSINFIRKKYGLSYHYIKKCQTQTFERKLSRCALPKETIQKVVDFFKRDDISRCDPSAASVSKKTHAPRRYMEKTLKDAYKQFVEETKIEISFSKFAKCRPKEIKGVKFTKLNTCCCEYCANITLKRDAINTFLAAKGLHCLMLPSKVATSDLTLCDKENNTLGRKSCIDRNCSNCGVQLVRAKLQPAIEMYTGAEVKWKKWALVKENISDRTGIKKTTCKRQLTTIQGTLDQVLSELEEELHTFSCHLANADWQHKAFANLKENLPENWLVLCMDFAENFGCFYQDEAQGAHWTRQQVTIHPVIAHYRCLQHHDTITESLIFISDDLQHDTHAVQHYQMIAVRELQSRGLQFTKIIHFSDGCASQYKGKTSFVDASYGEEDIGTSTEEHFFGSRHGKGPCDAEIGAVKRVVSTAVKARQAQVSTAEEMFNFCTRRLTRPESAETHSHNRRKFLFVPQSTINRHRPDRTGPEIKTVAGTRTLHCARGMAPYVLSIRERSCFCLACTSEEGLCANAAFCGDWRVVHLKKKTARPQQNEPTKISTTASANEEYPDTNTSPVPARITAASVSEAVTDVFQANSIRAGQYLMVSVPVQQGRKTIRKEYGAVVLQVQEDDIEVRYLRQKDGKYYFPDTEDDAWIVRADIVGHLDIAQMATPRTWTPYKELQEIVEAAIHKKQPDAVHDLEVSLQKHKPDFLSLLKTPAKNAAFRELVRKSKTEGIPIHGEQGTQTFSEDFIQEALIISDLFELNEFAALELLIAGEDEKPSYPGLTRGLLAVLLFYDGRKSLVLALRTLMQSLTGRTWTLELSPELSELTNTYIQQLIEGKLTDRILELISKMDLTLEMDKLQNNRALGSVKYKRQVQDIYMEIKTSLAECLFCLSCQRGLSKDDTLRLLAHLRKDNCLEADGSISPVSLHLLMALLFAFDVSILELEDAEEMAQELAVCKDPGFVAEIHKELTSDTPWAVPGLKAVAQFAWGLMLRQISQFPVAADVGDSCEEDEMLIDTAIDNQVFLFLHNSVLTAKDFHQEEFHLRRLHGLLTDFIYHMPLKVKDIRNRGDEAARIMLAHIQEGQEPPSTLKRDFEHLLNLLGHLYSKDPLHLELALEYWCPPEPNSTSFQDVYHYRPPQRQVALHKFVRMAGDLLPASLYVPYVTMLEGLATGPHCSQHCFNLLKINGGSASIVSWDHIFSSLGQYYTSLRREAPSSHDASHVYRAMHSRIITSQELEGLLAIISLTRTIVSESESCRIALCENQQWSAIVVLFGLVTCSVPAPMKAELLRMLAALAKTPEIASNLWQTLEASQILVTIPTSGQQKGGIKVELDEIESRNEEYVITRAFLELLDTLTDIPIPAALGAGVRAAGFDPYLEFIRDDVFLKFGSRAYKNAGEKWEMAVSALQIMKKLLQNHEIVPEDFVDQVVELQGVGTMPINKPPGHILMVYMLRDTELFSQILKILDDGIKLLELYSHIPGQSSLEKACLLCLQMIECALEKEDQFVNMIRNTGANIMVTSMDKMLLGINPRSLKADNLVNIAKYVMFNSSLPNQSLSAVRILYLVCKSASVQRVMVNLFTENQAAKVDLLHGFVECLEQDDVEMVEMNLDLMSEKMDEDLMPSQLRNLTRQHLLKLLLYSLEQSAPNLAHFLLGFEIRKPVGKTTLQDAGVLNSPKTCLHAILTLLNRGAGSGSGPNCLRETPVLAELCYQLIYHLAANKDTSLPTLRYLRTSHDFLFRQIQHLPFDSEEIGHNVTNHQSWLLKTLAVELRLTSLNRQRSHTQRLMKLLLDDKDADETEVLQVVGSENPELPSSSRYGDQSMFHTSQYGRRVIGQQSRRKLMRLLDSLEFTQEYPDQLDLEFFEPHMIQQVMASVEGKTEQGICYYNVKTLHRILMNELNNLPGTTMAGQRTHIQEEIESILRIVVARNNVSQSLHSKRQAFDAWRHVTEVILTSCPEDLLAGEARQSLLFELLQDLLLKISDENALSELTAPASGVLLTLIANLQQCFFSEDLESNGKEARSSQYTSQLERSQGTSLSGVSWGQGSGSRTLFATSLQITLKGLIEHLLRSSGRQQRVRVKLYGALLYYLQIVQRPKAPSGLSGDAASKSIESRLLAAADTEYDHLKRENITTILSYGDKLMDLVCRDACDGLDVGRMLALSVLDTILTMDKFQQWQSFLSSKGYLQHLIDSIASDDSSLVDLLGFKLSILKSLYLFESKMSLLTRVAESAVGAYTLLHCGIMNRLASCTFFDMRPEVERLPSAGEEEEDDEFLPDIMSRYRRLLLATLKLCLAILTSLGIENIEAGMKVMQFVVAHGDVFHSILRDRQPSLNLQTLKELALTTAVLARANSQGDEASEFSEVDTAAIEFRGHRARIQRQMIALLPKYCLSERMNKQLKTLEGKETREKKNLKEEITLAFLEVATNVTTYCRAIVSNSGPSAQYCQILFGPSLEEAMSKDLRGSDEFSLSSLSPAQSPNLGVIVYQIKQCSNSFISVFDSHKQHLRKLEGLAELSSEDLKQFSGVATVEMSSQHRQLLAKKRLTQIIHYNYRQLQFLSYILENCLFLLWRHLEYYLIHCVPLEKQPSVYQGYIRRQQQMRRLQDVTGLSGSSRLPDQEAASETFELEDQRKGVSQQEIETLKQTAVSVLNESLFKKVQEINQNFCKGRTHYGFVEAVNRRIKGLLRLHTGS